jgi:hypothetical protein
VVPMTKVLLLVSILCRYPSLHGDDTSVRRCVSGLCNDDLVQVNHWSVRVTLCFKGAQMLARTNASCSSPPGSCLDSAFDSSCFASW